MPECQLQHLDLRDNSLGTASAVRIAESIVMMTKKDVLGMLSPQYCIPKVKTSLLMTLAMGNNNIGSLGAT